MVSKWSFGTNSLSRSSTWGRLCVGGWIPEGDGETIVREWKGEGDDETIIRIHLECWSDGCSVYVYLERTGTVVYTHMYGTVRCGSHRV